MESDYSYATVLVTFEYDAEQLARVRRRAAELDAGNLGTDDPPESYSPALAFARILATDDEIVSAIFGHRAPGVDETITTSYTAEPQED